MLCIGSSDQTSNEQHQSGQCLSLPIKRRASKRDLPASRCPQSSTTAFPGFTDSRPVARRRLVLWCGDHLDVAVDRGLATLSRRATQAKGLLETRSGACDISSRVPDLQALRHLSTPLLGIRKPAAQWKGGDPALGVLEVEKNSHRTCTLLGFDNAGWFYIISGPVCRRPRRPPRSQFVGSVARARYIDTFYGPPSQYSLI